MLRRWGGAKSDFKSRELFQMSIVEAKSDAKWDAKSDIKSRGLIKVSNVGAKSDFFLVGVTSDVKRRG